MAGHGNEKERKMIQEIAKKITELSGTYSGYDIFSDWIKALALSLSNSTDVIHDTIWRNRENQYMEIVKKHGQKTMEGFVELGQMLIEALDKEIRDVLGAVFMAGNWGAKQTGQFFTPFHLSVLTAEMTIPKNVSEEQPFIINEPSTGGGGMIIAAARVLKDRGINPQRCMEVVAQDLDWKGVYMTYVQLSLLGIKATVVQGDTLCEPFDERKYSPERVLYTPARKELLM